ncbi:hypothetical protein [Nocardioides sp. L-11A]|uniref:hypothetical protein n=1 Tax=Nocardioides sp. L-11A TaxID=3043848 RepID=UPI00249BE735|nr:hypothetical protein QJ852_09885 [Nocardioides sp. L-11A]
MTRSRGTWFVSDTSLTILSDSPGARFPDRMRLALKGWIEHHGGDPMDMPLVNTFTRLVDEHAIEYDIFERDADGRRHLVVDDDGEVRRGFARRRHRLQLDEPPLPFPDEFQFQPLRLVSEPDTDEVPPCEPPRPLCETDPHGGPPACTDEPGCDAAEHMLCCPSLLPDDDLDEQDHE